MASTFYVGATLVWILLLSGHSVGGRVAPTNAGLASYNQNISVSSRYHNFAMGIFPPSPRNSHDQVHAVGANRVGHWALIQSHGQYHDVLTSLNIYGVPVKANQISSTVVSLSIGADGPLEQLEAIAFGWHVWPAHYGDNDTHFFIAWTKDGFQSTGCYNLDCGGFVFDKQSPWRPGIKLGPLSEPNGKQYYLTVRIAKTPMAQWYLYYGTDWDKPIGYWPQELFNHLWDYGTRVDVGGNVEFTRGEPSPPMGNGLWLSNPNEKAAMICAQYNSYDGGPFKLPGSINVDRGDCYSLARLNGDYYYGGPGGCID